jgi:hypothetical protein
MSFRLEIATDNAAFDDAPAVELARILRELADRVEEAEAGDVLPVRDLNGNRVGSAHWEMAEE